MSTSFRSDVVKHPVRQSKRNGNQDSRNDEEEKCAKIIGKTSKKKNQVDTSSPSFGVFLVSEKFILFLP